MLAIRTAALLCVLIGPPVLVAAPSSPPKINSTDIEVGPPNLLTDSALEFLESQSRLLDKHAASAIKANKIDISRLPDPTTRPAGSLTLALSAKQLMLRERLAATATWSLDVPAAADRQYVFALHLAHFFEGRYSGGASTSGVALQQFSGRQQRTKTEMPLVVAGRYRAMAILSARSIKTGQTQILDVAEVTYSVAPH